VVSICRSGVIATPITHSPDRARRRGSSQTSRRRFSDDTNASFAVQVEWKSISRNAPVPLGNEKIKKTGFPPCMRHQSNPLLAPSKRPDQVGAPPSELVLPELVLRSNPAMGKTDYLTAIGIVGAVAIFAGYIARNNDPIWLAGERRLSDAMVRRID
jgi:hypothetical protein